MTENKEMVDVKKQETSSWEEVLENEISFAPFVNIFETTDNFVLVANVPGLSKDDVKLKLEEGALSIFGKINYDEAMNRKYILNETGVGNYYRKFRISNSIDESKIEAEYSNGQLKITLPKHDRIKPRTIEINPDLSLGKKF